MKVFNWVSQLFENWIDPFKAPQDNKPPNHIWGFFTHFVGQARSAYIALLIFTGLTSYFEAAFFFYMGRLIDLLDTADPALGWQNFIASNAVELTIMLVVVLIGRFIAPVLQSLLEGQTIGRSFNALVLWQSYSYVSRQSLTFFQNDFAGRIVTKVSQAANAMAEFVGSIIQVGWAFVIFLGTTLFLFFQLDWRMLVLTLVWMAAFAATAWYFVPRARSQAAENAEASSVVNGRVVDNFSNIQTLKLFATDEESDDYVRRGMTDFLGVATRLTRTITGMRALLSLQAALAIVAFGILSISLWQGGLITVGAVAFSLSLILRLNMMLGRLMGQLNQMMRSFGVVQNAMETIAQPLGLTDRPNAVPLVVKNARIEFDHVTFGYTGDRGVVHDFSLDVKPGERIGLVGHSGAGKSTLVSLLLRFYDLQKGTIKIDGQDVAGVTQESLRSNIGVVTQDTALLHRSVRDNIGAGRPQATLEEIEQAARAAEAHEFIEKLVDHRGRKGYMAQVGERGVKLSGGQRQRIAIARVVLKDAPILVLDEATSALDSEVEAAIQSQLENLMAGKTVIAIAHRLSTIAKMDRLIVLEEGRVVQQGTHDELIEQKGAYGRLWARQSGGFLQPDAAE